ncbi:MAG: hypothetical protein MRY78_14530 [Saprospiraceae bacterium]|nr:hypothetical protein [Saprospiraceae bacterium]
MAQFNWTYLADDGKAHKVGLFHGNKTGHVLIHVNSKIVLIDFSVYESKNYSIFLDDELCEISLERKDGKFWYGMKVDKEVDTPKNRERKKTEKKYWRQTLLFFGSLIGFVLLLLFLVSSFNSPASNEEQRDWLALGSEEVVAKVLDIRKIGDKTILETIFVVGNQPTVSTQAFDQPQPLLNGVGIPILEGDEVYLRYATAQKQVTEWMPDSYTRNQLQKYKKQALQKQLALNDTQTEAYAKCLIQTAIEEGETTSWAHFYFQDTPPAENPDYNRQSYLRLIRDGAFQKAVFEKCWE